MQMWNPPQKAERVRKWAKYLAPVGHSSGISVPKSWANFCTLTLLDPERFELAKAFLGSKAWSLVINNNASEASLTFSLPSKCPLKEKNSCSAAAEVEGGSMESDFDNAPDLMSPKKEGISPMASASTSSLQLKRKPSKVPLVLTEVRRSDRLKGKSFGYKGDFCQGRNCLCCSTEPPTLSRRVIRKLGN
jgi:hypothetical protein